MTPITPQTMYQGKPKKAYQDALQKYSSFHGTQYGKMNLNIKSMPMQNSHQNLRFFMGIQGFTLTIN